jgi:hypothetical protein
MIMSQNIKPEIETPSDGRLDPDINPSGYPSKWDLSELCKPGGGRNRKKKKKKLETAEEMTAKNESLESFT